jgi:hypothetical protein
MPLLRSAKEMLISACGHPFGASQVALPGTARAYRFSNWIDLQEQDAHLAPIGTIRVCIKEP